MPADYLSRNLVSAISWDSDDLLQAQTADLLIKARKNFLLNKELLHDPKCQALVRLFSNDCFIEDGLVWRRIKCQFEPSGVVLFLPASLTTNAMTEAHGELLTGHDGIYKTKEHLMQCFYWPGMDADIAAHLKSCYRCQLGAVMIDPHPRCCHHYPYLPNQVSEFMRISSAHSKPRTRVKSSFYASRMHSPNMSNWSLYRIKKLPWLRKPYSTSGSVALEPQSTW